MANEKSDFNVRGFYSKLNFFSELERVKMRKIQEEQEKQYFDSYEIIQSDILNQNDKR